MESILAADYTNGYRGRSAILTINRIENGRRTELDMIPVTGKREARKIAKVIGATPWNF